MTDYDMIERLIAELGRVRERPTMYLGTCDDLDRLEVFLCGFSSACVAAGIDVTLNDLRSAVRRRGYTWGPSGPAGVVNQLAGQGLMAEEIIRERIGIEIDLFEEKLASSSKCPEV